jgi:coproporphyrinogen III oxidase
VGGIFFDNLHDESPEQLFKFVDSCAKSLTPSYLPLVAKRKDTPYTEQQRHWQLVRRGRYVEFNLVYDKGTSYGLAQPGARVKSILVSMPATVKFEYDEQEPAAGTKEANLLQALRKPREWADLKL